MLLQWLCFSPTFKCRGWFPLGGQVDRKDCRRSSPAKKCAATHFLLQSPEKKPRWRQAVNNTGGPEFKLRVGLTRLSKNWKILTVVFPLNPVQPIRSKPNWPAQLQAIKWLYWLFAKYDITFCEYQLVLPQVLQFILPFKMKFCAPKRMIYYNEHPIMWVYERGCVIGVIDNKNPIFSEKYHLYIHQSTGMREWGF